MTTKRINSIFRVCILALGFTAFLSSCAPEMDEPGDQPKFTMGDPKNDSPQGSRCYTISEFTVEGEDQSIAYSDIVWEFRNNGTFFARTATQEWPGNWNVGVIDGIQKFIMIVDDTLPPTITAVGGIYNVESLNLNLPVFVDDEGDILQFAQTSCDIISPELEALNAFLQDSLVVITSFVRNDNDFTTAFNNITFDFRENNKVIAQRNEQQKAGLWLTSQPIGSLLQFEIQFNNIGNPLAALNAAWEVLEVNENSILLEYLDGPPDMQDYIIITMEH